MSAPLIFLAIDVAAVVCAVLVALRALTRAPRLWSARLVALIAVNTACSVVLSHQEYGYWMPAAFRIDVGGWVPVLNLARNLTPGLIMLLCHALFTDRARVPVWLLALLAVQMALEEPLQRLIPAGWPSARLVTETIPALLQALFVVTALYWTVADWRVDLVEARRRARAAMLFVVGFVTIAAVLLTRVVINPDSEASYLVRVALTAAYVLIGAVILLRVLDGDFAEVLGRDARAPAGPRPGAEHEIQAALGRLSKALEDERICHEPGLTLKGLADHVGLPEYRLRRLIHERLGYRNFNAMLHDYRVREACRQLSDPGQRRTPILTIALSVGYSSVNTFNRGFREIMAVTPSDYRSLALAKAAPETE